MSSIKRKSNSAQSIKPSAETNKKSHPKVVISPETWDRMWGITNKLPNLEWQGIAPITIEYEKNSYSIKKITVGKLYVPEQTVTSGDVVTPDIGVVMTEIVMDGGTNGNCWIHSHNSMNVFWSGTDAKNIENMLEGRLPLLSIVLNAKNEYKCRLDSRFPWRTTIDDIPIEVEKSQEDLELIVFDNDGGEIKLPLSALKPEFLNTVMLQRRKIDLAEDLKKIKEHVISVEKTHKVWPMVNHYPQGRYERTIQLFEDEFEEYGITPEIEELMYEPPIVYRMDERGGTKKSLFGKKQKAKVRMFNKKQKKYCVCEIYSRRYYELLNNGYISGLEEK